MKFVIAYALAGLELYHDVRGFRFPARLRPFSDPQSSLLAKAPPGVVSYRLF